jgi:hypothetical protein
LVSPRTSIAAVDAVFIDRFRGFRHQPGGCAPTDTSTGKPGCNAGFG